MKCLRMPAVVSALALFAFVDRASPAADAPPPATPAHGPRAVEPVRQWSNSVKDEALQKEAPAGGVVGDEKKLAALWRAWKVGEQPKVDFAKQILVVETTSGSLLHVTARLKDDGDLQVLAMASMDLRPGFRYQILLLPREGVKTVNGHALP